VRAAIVPQLFLDERLRATIVALAPEIAGKVVNKVHSNPSAVGDDNLLKAMLEAPVSVGRHVTQFQIVVAASRQLRLRPPRPRRVRVFRLARVGGRSGTPQEGFDMDGGHEIWTSARRAPWLTARELVRETNAMVGNALEYAMRVRQGTPETTSMLMSFQSTPGGPSEAPTPCCSNAVSEL
jgi:hypothetical protein